METLEKLIYDLYKKNARQLTQTKKSTMHY